MDNIQKKVEIILKQPSMKIADLVRKKGIDMITPEDIKFMLKDISNFFKLLVKNDIHVFFVIDYKRTGIIDKSVLLSKTQVEIINLSSSDNYIFFLDKSCHIIETALLKDYLSEDICIKTRLAYEDIVCIAETFDTTFIYGYGDEYDVYHDGKLIQPSCSVDLSFIPNKIVSCVKPISKYNELIRDHYNQCVKYSQATSHWDKKDIRIMRSAPEDIFKNSLWYYLYMFSEDTNCNVIAEYPLRSGDEIDIYAQNRDNDIYIFEVKVLGKYCSENLKGYNEYYENRVHDGLNQTILYINELKDNMQEVEKAELIVYDAREIQKPISIPDSERHEKMGEPIYLYLESKNATKKAKMMTSSKKSS